MAENTDVRQVTLSGVVTTLTGTGNGKSGFTDGPFALATFGFVDGLEGIATDGVNLYVSDPPNIRLLNMDAGVVSTLQTQDGGPGDLNAVPSGLAFLNGVLYTVNQGELGRRGHQSNQRLGDPHCRNARRHRSGRR